VIFTDYIRALALEMNVSIEQAREWHDAFVRVSYMALARDDVLVLKDLGTISIIRVGSREIQNVNGGETVQTREYNRPAFRMSSNLKRALRGEEVVE